MTAIAFVKASACGNDFLIVEGSAVPGANHLSDLPALTRKMCDRHQGIGADGVEWLFPASDADVHARLLNADGSEAEISGNGTRCVAAYICSAQNKEKIVIRTGAGLKTCILASRHDVTYEFETLMGQPEVNKESVIELAHSSVAGIPVSMGNPHYVVFVDAFPAGWQAWCAEIQKSGHFKHGINVEMVVIKDKDNIEVRFFERGVGETQSSGTGSCAAAVAAISTGRAESSVQVHAPGGMQVVRWEQEVFLRGPAELICRGEFFV